jgi:hypothetical protein
VKEADKTIEPIEKAIADLVQTSAASRLQVAMAAADQSVPADAPAETAAKTVIPISSTTRHAGRDTMAVNTTEMTTPVTETVKAEPAPAPYGRTGFPKVQAQSQMAISLRLKARAMRAVLLALNEGHTPWDDFSAEHVRAYEAICDQLSMCLHSKRRDRS